MYIICLIFFSSLECKNLLIQRRPYCGGKLFWTCHKKIDLELKWDYSRTGTSMYYQVKGNYPISMKRVWCFNFSCQDSIQNVICIVKLIKFLLFHELRVFVYPSCILEGVKYLEISRICLGGVKLKVNQEYI